MDVHHRLQRLQWTKDDVRRALVKCGVTVAPPAPLALVKAHSDQHFRTTYLDGEAQRHRKASLKANEAFILGRLLRGTPAKLLAAACMVTDVAIYNRGEGLGLNSRRPAGNRELGCGAQMLDR